MTYIKVKREAIEEMIERCKDDTSVYAAGKRAVLLQILIFGKEEDDSIGNTNIQ